MDPLESGVKVRDGVISEVMSYSGNDVGEMGERCWW